MFTILAACSSNDGKKNISDEELLTQYKKEYSELKVKITELEKQIKSSSNNEEKIKVRTSKLSPQKFEHFIGITGNVEADKNITINPETSGNIIKIPVYEGQNVRKNDTLAILNTEQIDRAISELQTNLSLSKTMFERQERLWNQKIGSEMEYLRAKTEKEALEQKLKALYAQKDLAIIKAPFNGIIDELYQKKGEMASPSIALAQLVNINKVYVEADISEIFLNNIKRGDSVEINFPAIGYNTNAKIARTSNVIDPANRTFKIRVNLTNKDLKIKPNLVSNLKLKDFESENSIVVPSILIKNDFDGNYIYLAVNQSNKLIAKKRYVKVDKTYNNKSLIVDGLEFGEKIISEGYAQVVNGSELNEIK
jgi:RND family efflux transporter MFP subunit